MPIAASIGLVFLAIFLIPILVYGALSATIGLQPPGENPTIFLVGVGVSKIGTAIAFVGIWVLGRDQLAPHWLLYVALWWVMFVLGEIGQAIGPDYSWTEAFAGIASETLYLPLSGFIVLRFLPAGGVSGV